MRGGVEKEAARKVQDIVAAHPGLHTLVIAEEEAQVVQHRLEQLGFGDQSCSIGLGSVSAVRNLGLVVAEVLGFDAVVFIDDDEVVEDEAFLEKAMYGLGKLTKKGIPILAKSGFYFNSEGTYYSQSQNRWYNHWWQQGAPSTTGSPRPWPARACPARTTFAAVASPFIAKRIVA